MNPDLEALGLELASLDRHVYEELIVVLRSRLGDGEITGFGQQPLLVSDGDLYNLFPRIRTTLLFSLLRNMMGRSFIWDGNISCSVFV